MTDQWTIHTNHEISRRKTFFIVTDPQGEIAFRHRFFWPCVDYLDAIGIECYVIVPSRTTEGQSGSLIIDRRKEVTWQN